MARGLHFSRRTPIDSQTVEAEMGTTNKNVWKGLWLAAGGMAIALALMPTDAPAQIATSKHNLGTSGNSTLNSTFSGTAEICVFCHTPHGANTGVAAPLWNKSIPTSTYQTYSTGNSYSIDGDVAPVGSVSLACLSCHDGSLAIATMINQPGSGGYNPAGAVLAGTWTSGSGNVDTTTGMMAANAITNLGTNLVNDHPIGIGYCGSSVAPAGATLTCGDADFNAPSSVVINGARVWFVEGPSGTGDGIRQKTDLSLYTRAGDGLPRVECASCHDPHNTTNGTFLRRSNAGSGVCLTCHIK
jgi:predicted CXXCH cytochrome family protein